MVSKGGDISLEIEGLDLCMFAKGKELFRMLVDHNHNCWSCDFKQSVETSRQGWMIPLYGVFVTLVL